MKSYTDFEQSKKLANILPIESADMHYFEPFVNSTDSSDEIYGEVKVGRGGGLPVWSLSALLENIPVSCDDGQHCFALINCNPKGDTEWLSCYEDCKGNLLNECYSDNPIDSCVEMIVKLKEKGLI